MYRVVVYSMGKVGSSALAQASERAGLAAAHIHSLLPERLTIKPGRKGLLTHQKQALEILANPPGDALWVTAVRDPIARAFSAVFQRLGQPHQPIATRDPRELAEIFESRDHANGISIRWLDEEFYPRFPESAASPFDTEARFASGENWIIFRDDCPDDTKSAVLSEALGAKITVMRDNTAADKGLADLYRETRALVSLPKSLLDHIYATPYARRFWSEDERARLASAWTRAPAFDVV